MRMRTRVLPLSVCLLAFTCAILLIVRGPQRAQVPNLMARAAASHSVGHKPSKLPEARQVNRALIGFEENHGQADQRVKFLTRGRDYGIFLGATDATIVHEGILNQDQINARADASAAVGTLSGANRRGYSKIRISWLGANENAQTEGIGKPQGLANYLLGNDPKKWQRKVPRYPSVKMKEIYPGIDLVYHGDVQHLEFDYVVAPHADPKSIQVKVDGPSLVSLETNGKLSISSGGDEVALLPPVAYQEVGGQRKPVEAKYALTASHQFEFQVGDYDHNLPLIIDPVLQFAANFGGGYNSLASDVEVDGSGNIYLTGTTCATDYPITPGVVQSTGGSNVAYACYDIIVTKLDPTASNLIYSTYLGGNDGANFATHMVLDSSGDVTLIGATNATNYPTTAGAYQTTMNKPGKCTYSQYVMGQACSSAILTKVSPDGSTLLFSTLLGGDRADLGVAVAVDATGNYYVTGATDSTAFPTTTGAYSTTYGGGTACQNGVAPCFDVFISEISADGTKLLASTYLGGEDDDYAASISLEGGNVFVAGSTDSNHFPKTHTLGTNSAHPGQRDVFVTKFNPALTTLGYSTVIGGSADDIETAMKVDSTGVVFFTGSTASTDFPVTTGSYSTTYAGPAQATCVSSLDASVVDGTASCGDVIVGKLSADGSSLTWATFLGGSASDFAYNLALDSAENVWVIGDSVSPDFPLTADTYYSPYATLFLSEISADGKTLPFSTSLESNTGGSGSIGLGIFIDHNNNVYVAGAGAGVAPTPGAYTTLNSPGVFVMEFSPGSNRPLVQVSPSSLVFGQPGTITPANAVSAPQSVTVTNTGTGTLHLSVTQNPANLETNTLNSNFLVDDNCGTTLAPSADCTINVQYAPTSQSVGVGDSTVLDIFSDAPGSPTIISLSGQAGTLDSASFVPATLTFNGQAPGSTSTSQLSGLQTSTNNTYSIEVRTTGAPVIGGANASDFHIDTSQCVLGATFCTFTVTFAPVGNTPAQRTATVTVASQAANSPEVLTLIGNVSTAPFITLNSNPYVSTPTTVNIGINGTLVIKNTGGATLNVTNMTLSGPNASEFVLSNAGCTVPAVSLTSGNACGITVLFTPTAAGLRTATLTFVDNEATPTQVTLQGIATTAGGAELSEFSTPSPTNGVVLYPDTVVGNMTTFNVTFVTILNLASGNASGAHLTPTLTGDFQFQPTSSGLGACPVAPAQLTAGNDCSYTVLFAPTAAGSRTGTLTIATDAPGNPSFVVHFIGNGVTVPMPTLTPSLLDFGPVSTGDSGGPQTLTLANKGNGNLTFGAPSIAAPFMVPSNTCVSPLAPNASCTINVIFSPTVLGSASGFISLNTNAAGQSLAAAFHGTGVTGPVLHASPSQLTFGNEAIGGSSAPQSITLSNPGSSIVSLNGLTISENFTQTNNCGATLLAGAICTVNVSFAPTNDNYPNFTVSGHLYVASTAPGTPLPIFLTGTAQMSNGAQVSINITSSENPSKVGDSVKFTAAITSQTAGTLTGTATFFDNGSQIGMPITIASGMAAVTDTQLTAGNHSITVNYSGDSNYAPANSSGFTQTVTGGSTSPDFTIAVAPTTLSLAAGASGTSTITITPSGGANFAVALSCGTLPAMVTCTPSPASLTLDGTHPATSTLTIATVAPTMVVPDSRYPRLPLGLLFSVALAALLLWATRFSKTVRPRRVLQATAILVLACGIASCGGSSHSSGGGTGPGGTTGGTTAGSYTIAITGAGPSGSPSHSASVSLAVTN